MLPNLRYFCGMLGHVEKECDDKLALEDEGKEVEYEYGEGLKASPCHNRKGIGTQDKTLNSKGAFKQLVFKQRP